MKTKVSKIKLFLVLACAVCMLLSSVMFVNSALSVKTYAEGEQTAEISGIQVRSAGGGSENFVVLLSDIYSEGVGGAITVANYNTRSKITIYTSQEDEIGKPAS